jgi:hypothetical protein
MAVPTPPPRDDEPLPPLPRPGATSAEIRAALHVEYRGAFERDFRAALDEAAQSLDLAVVLDVMEIWRRRCCITRDRESYRRMMRRASELLFGEVPPEDEPTTVTETGVLSAPGRQRPH